MKSLQSQIVWRTLLYILIVLLLSVFIIAYIIEVKSQDNIAPTIEFIRESKFRSLNKDNLATAFDFSSLSYTSYIVNEMGELIISGNYKPDTQVIDLCRNTTTVASQKYQVSGIDKYVAVRKNGNLCLVVEGNTNTNIMLGQYTRNILFAFSGILLLLLSFSLWRSYRKISRPIKTVTDNSENALISKWESIQKTNTKIPELMNLDKFSQYLIEILKQKGGTGENSKVENLKEVSGKFLNKKNQEEASKFRMAVESAVDVIIIVDKFGYINYGNRALTTLTGLTLEDVENKRVTDLWHKDNDITLWKQNYEKVAKENKPVQFVTTGMKKNNLKFEASVQISPIKNSDGTVENFLVTERDVTEEKQKERIKTEFISVVSHELRTPMTVIRGYSTLLTEGKLGELNQKQKDYIEKINEETGKLLELANDMLDIQKFESGKIELKFEKTKIPTFVENIVKGYVEQYAKKGLKLSFENHLEHDTGNIDVKYFARVITNMLTNAYKYTEKGEVKVFCVNPDEQHIVIAVKDTGIGIKEEALNHLFERFYQADGVMQRKQEGTGLGLSIVKTVTESHSGMVWVESKVGVGTTFYVAIPVV